MVKEKTNYFLIKVEEDIFLLDRLIQQETFKSPYTKEDFRSISDVDIEIFKNSISLLEDFYTDIIPHIVGISEKTDIKVKKR